MKGSRVQEEEPEEEEGEDGRCRRRGEETGDCGPSGKEDWSAESERCRYNNQKGADAGVEGGYAPLRTANIRGDSDLSEGAKMSYADVLAAARKKIPLKEIGVDSVDMKKAMTGAIIIRIPGDRDGGKAFRLATHLAEVLDPTAVRVVAPTRTASCKGMCRLHTQVPFMRVTRGAR
jgi:hypothetical protein